MGDHELASVRSDALERAWRTLWQGFILDGLVAVGGGAMAMVQDGDLTSPVFWSTLGLFVAKSFLVAFVSYLARLKMPPKNG